MSTIASLFSVAGKRVFVTGGAKGIGRMITEGYVKNGATVVVSGRKAEDCEDCAEELTALGPGTCLSLPADLSDWKASEDVVAQLKDLLGSEELDVLVNNAGTAWGQPFEEFTEKGFDRVFDLNVKGLFRMTQVCAPMLRKASQPGDASSVVNVGSVVGIQHQSPPTYSYDASKAAVHSLTAKLARDLSPEVRVNCIAPGFVATNMTKAMPMYTDGRPLGSPMSRMGNADDMAAAAICEALIALLSAVLFTLPYLFNQLILLPISPIARRSLLASVGVGDRRGPPGRRWRANDASAPRGGAEVETER